MDPLRKTWIYFPDFSNLFVSRFEYDATLQLHFQMFFDRKVWEKVPSQKKPIESSLHNGNGGENRSA